MEILSRYHCSESKSTESERLDLSVEKDRSCIQELKITKIRNQTQNLWEFISSKSDQTTADERIDESTFKLKNSKQYLEVRRSFVNNGCSTIAVFNDISRIKVLEKTSKKMREMYFQSVDHELRTPLNSIIPIVQMIIEFYHTKLDAQLMSYMKIILNSSLHLQHLIDDALDMCRIENNKFTIQLENFNIRETVKEVTDIMDFLIKSKGLKIIINISRNVPEIILSDAKRFKQILFNLVGNAVKFTFQGEIEVALDFLDNHILQTVVKD